MKKVGIAVIGAGASGLMAARCAAAAMIKAGRQVSVLLLEGNSKPGKKLLATGNGRCNLSNVNICAGRYHGDAEEASRLFSDFPAAKLVSEFEEMGLCCRADGEGRIYPYNFQSAAVLRLLRLSCEENGVELQCGFNAFSVVRGKTGFTVKSEAGDEILAEKLILASGGAASPNFSCGRNGYDIAADFGHRVIKPLPSLAPMRTSDRLPGKLKGIRARAGLRLMRGEKIIYEESGEVIFAQGQISGICVFNASACCSRAFAEGNTAEKLNLSLDLLEKMSKDELFAYLKKQTALHPDRPSGELLAGVVNMRIGEELVKRSGTEASLPLRMMDDRALKKLCGEIKALGFEISGLGAFSSAQVTDGGVPLSEIDTLTMGSRIVPGLYLCGELLNLHGECGGYNLHFAFISGLVAGKSAAGDIIYV